MIEKTCCFTGHRKLDLPEREIEKRLYKTITKAVENGYIHFICGGAVGFDTLAAEQVIFLKCAGHDIKLELAIPCNDQDKKWSNKQKIRYQQILEYADKIHKRDLPFHKFCVQWRNQYMVNKSSLVIAYFNGTAGGTKNTLEYARQKDLEIWKI